MKSEYDFSKMKGRRNPYAKRLKKPVTIRLGGDLIVFNRIERSNGLRNK